jgi:hypothetical protein
MTMSDRNKRTYSLNFNGPSTRELAPKIHQKTGIIKCIVGGLILACIAAFIIFLIMQFV